ncbi:hypothetical protein Syun_016864 [Stephania yunnanensis]|uniref:Uncharacterized protein n=1 Tax=Stephania yunnanensis TaxID=152371 RepID=A0AAP0J5J7_9MAGN
MTKGRRRGGRGRGRAGWQGEREEEEEGGEWVGEEGEGEDCGVVGAESRRGFLEAREAASEREAGRENEIGLNYSIRSYIGPTCRDIHVQISGANTKRYGGRTRRLDGILQMITSHDQRLQEILRLLRAQTITSPSTSAAPITQVRSAPTVHDPPAAPSVQAGLAVAEEAHVQA